MPGPRPRGKVLLVSAHASRGIDAVTQSLIDRGLEVVGPRDPATLPTDAAAVHCAIVDLSESNGAMRETLARLCRATAPRVLVITAADDATTRIAALQLGADDHVVAPFDPREVVVRVEVLLARAAARRRPGLQNAGIEIDLDGRRALYHGQDIPLTPREFEILVVLMAADGRAVPKVQLLKEVWDDTDRSVNVVEAHVSALRRKLEAYGPQLVHTVHRQGYAFRPPRGVAPSTRDALVAERARLLRERDEAVRRRDELLAAIHRSAEELRRG